MKIHLASEMSFVILALFSVSAFASPSARAPSSDLCVIKVGSGDEIAARVVNNILYRGSSGEDLVARYNGNEILRGENSLAVLAHFKDGLLLAGISSDQVLAHIQAEDKGFALLRGEDSMAQFGHTENCTAEQSLLGAEFLLRLRHVNNNPAKHD